MIIIGIDIGGSTTKIIGLTENEILKPLQVEAKDPITSLYGALGNYISKQKFTLKDIDEIHITGVGASYVSSPIFDIPTIKVKEFDAIGRGGLYLSKLEKAIIVSMGTGTAIIKADGDISHIGGTGIGGGTLLGLAERMLNIRDINLLTSMSEKGNLSNIDLQIKDITQDYIENLPPSATASNFGKNSDIATNEDVALGIMNLVFQAIVMSASMSALNTNINNIVFIGKLSVLQPFKLILNDIKHIFNFNFVIPEYSEFATALGATLIDKK